MLGWLKKIFPRGNKIITLEMPEDTYKNLDKLRCASSSKSVAETIAKSLSIYEFLIKETGLGARVVICRENDELFELEIF